MPFKLFLNFFTLLLMVFLSLNTCDKLGILEPYHKLPADQDWQYALFTQLTPGHPVTIIVSKVLGVNRSTVQLPFPGAVDNAQVTFNDTLIHPLEYYPDLRGRGRNYNYISREILPCPGQSVVVRAIIGSDTLTGSTILPTHFTYEGYSEGILSWSQSTNARIYDVKAYYPEPDGSEMRWKEFVNVLTFDTTSTITEHLKYEHRKLHDADFVNIPFDSIRFAVTAFDGNYYKVVLNNALQAGVRGGYGMVGSSVTIDTVYKNSE